MITRVFFKIVAQVKNAKWWSDNTDDRWVFRINKTPMYEILTKIVEAVFKKKNLQTRYSRANSVYE